VPRQALSGPRYFPLRRQGPSRLRRRYIHLAIRRHQSIAKVAIGRKLAIRLYWVWRNGCEYSPSFEFGSYAGQLGTGHGVQYNVVHLMGHPAP
jgi:hypothetical protein